MEAYGRAPRARKSLAERFWAKVNKDGPGGCWLWTGCTTTTGYGFLRYGGRAHRLAWVICVGPIADGLIVCHRCDVRACVNPAHLFLGTNTDNHRDMEQKGRQAKGFSIRRKLTPDAVRLIRQRAAEGRRQHEIAAEVGVTRGAIGHVLRGLVWGHVQ